MGLGKDLRQLKAGIPPAEGETPAPLVALDAPRHAGKARPGAEGSMPSRSKRASTV
jgi:hypothetical protein